MQQWQVGPTPSEYLYPNSTQHAGQEMHPPHAYQPQADMARRTEFANYPQATNAQHAQQQQHHQQQQQHTQHQQHGQTTPHAQHAQHAQHQQQPQSHHATPVQPPMTIPQATSATQQKPATPTPASASAPRGRKRAAPSGQNQQQTHVPPPAPTASMSTPTTAAATTAAAMPSTPAPAPVSTPTQPSTGTPMAATAGTPENGDSTPSGPPTKKSRTNTPWTPAEELRLKQMRDAGNSWAEIAKTFPSRTEGSVKKHWYKDMHYAEFAEDESAALLTAIKEYENSKWKSIGQKVGKPAKACEQYAKEHFPDLFPSPKAR